MKHILNIVKHREPLIKHHETLKTSWNIMKQSSFDATISAQRRWMRRRRRSARRRRRSRGVTGDIGTEFKAISAIAELV